MRLSILFSILLLTNVVNAQKTEELKFLKSETQKSTQINASEFKRMTEEWNAGMTKTATASEAASASRKEAYRRVALANEDFAAFVEKQYLVLLRNSFEKKDSSILKNVANDSISFSLISNISKLKHSAVDGIEFSESTGLKQEAGKSNFVAELDRYFSEFKTIEFVETRLLKLGVGYADINKFEDVYMPEFQNPKFTIFFEVKGIQQDGRRRNDKFDVSIKLNKLGDQKYEFAAIQTQKVITARLTREPAFKIAAANAGFNAGKVWPRLEALRRGGYGFAVEDFNGDGVLDAFVGNYGSSSLWVGSKSGEFKEIAVPDVNKVTLAKAAAFVDLNNDGWKDLVITRFAADNLVGDIVLFKNESGKFTKVENAFPSEILRDYAMPMAIADYNNDGKLDIYIGFPGERDFSAGPAPTKKFTVSHGLFLNRGDFKFLDQTDKLENSAGGRIAPHGAMASDMDADGKTDLVIMDDQKNLSPIYRNNGDGTFQIQNAEMKIMNHGYGMGIAAGDFNQDGRQDYIMSNATFDSQGRLLVPFKNGFNYSYYGLNKGLRLFYNRKDGGFKEEKSLSLLQTGEGAGGATTIDYDSDGKQDIYLVNGLWSGTSRDEKIDSLFAKADALEIANLNHLQDGSGERSPDGSKSIFMKVLMKEKVSEGGVEKTMSFAGYQRNKLFKNLGNGEFLEVGYLEGVDSLSDGYMSVVADLNRDGKPELLLRNCDPGTMENPFPVIEVFQNQHRSEKSLWLTFKGEKSNRSGVGARVVATVGKQQHYREVFANNSAAQGEISVHIGLGTENAAKTVKVYWPSGLVDTYKNVKAGRHELVETFGGSITNPTSEMGKNSPKVKSASADKQSSK